jgi:hypothetical protein
MRDLGELRDSAGSCRLPCFAYAKVVLIQGTREWQSLWKVPPTGSLQLRLAYATRRDPTTKKRFMKQRFAGSQEIEQGLATQGDATGG